MANKNDKGNDNIDQKLCIYPCFLGNLFFIFVVLVFLNIDLLLTIPTIETFVDVDLDIFFIIFLIFLLAVNKIW